MSDARRSSRVAAVVVDERVGGAASGRARRRHRAHERGGDGVGVALHRRDGAVDLERARPPVGVDGRVDAHGGDGAEVLGVARDAVALERREVGVQLVADVPPGIEGPAAGLGGRGQEQLGVGRQRGELGVLDDLRRERRRDGREAVVGRMVDGEAAGGERAGVDRREVRATVGAEGVEPGEEVGGHRG